MSYADRQPLPSLCALISRILATKNCKRTRISIVVFAGLPQVTQPEEPWSEFNEKWYWGVLQSRVDILQFCLKRNRSKRTLCMKI